MDSEEGGLLTTSAFSEDNVRRGFIKKVYSILSAQLIVTMAIMGFFFIQPVRIYATQNQWIFWVAFAASFVCLIALSCFEGVRRNFPGNLICLGVFTVGKFFKTTLMVKNVISVTYSVVLENHQSKAGKFLVTFQSRARTTIWPETLK